MHYFKPVIVIVFIVFFSSVGILFGAPTESQISAIYTAVSGGKPFVVDGTEATFSDGTNSWTIFGAVQDKGDLYSRPALWSVPGEYDVKIVDNAISDTMILPFSEPLPNVNSETSISLKACRGEYEPASFVLRSGISKLANVTVTVSDLVLEGSTAKIDSWNVDVRVVNCWFQAGFSIDRRDDNEKRLVSELLLHDNDLVRVDYENQVNIVRDISIKENFLDSETLVAFDIPEKFNQQIWLTFNIPGNSPTGRYVGSISVKFTVNGSQRERLIPVTVDVNSYELLPPPIECALYYLARYIPASENYYPLGSRGKIAVQMLSEFKDMREHGLTNVAIDHEYKLDGAGNPDLSLLSPVLGLYRDAGFSSNRLLYVDWQVTYYNNMTLYGEKLGSIFSLGQQNAFSEFYVYGKDEASYDELQAYRDAFSKVHQAGGKNFMACLRNVATLLRGDIDVAILPRDTSLENFNTPDNNLVINGDMSIGLEDTGSGWVSTDRAFLDVENGKLKKIVGAYVYLVQQLPVENGKSYLLEYEISSVVKATGLVLAAGGGSCVASDVVLATQLGKNSVSFTCNTDGSMLRFAFGTADQFELDNVVVKETSNTVPESISIPDENLVVNGDMSVGLEDAGSSWVSTDRAFLDVENGKLKKIAGAYVYLIQQLPIENGESYLLEYEISSVLKATGLALAAGGGSCVASDIVLATQLGNNSVTFTCNTDGLMLRFAFGTADQFEMDNVVVKAISTTSTTTSTATSTEAEIVPWAYNGPQAGKEVPGTYQDRFGVSLLEDGYQGECNYAYQTGNCWNDWDDNTWRPHVMAYPTAVKPVPTLQWEGWREGIDAMRHHVSQLVPTLKSPTNLRVK